MENYLCQDVLTIIYKLIPFHAKALALTCKYSYTTFEKYKNQMCEGNYILSPTQLRIIDDILKHLQTKEDEIILHRKETALWKSRYDQYHHLPLTPTKSLIIQAPLSLGKTAVMLAFSLTYYKGTVVIIVPPSILPHWRSEIDKMYNTGLNINSKKKHSNKSIAVVHSNYYDATAYHKCKLSNFNPSSIGLKVIVITSAIASHFGMFQLTAHSLVIEDEVHKRNCGVSNPNYIGFTASKTEGWTKISTIFTYPDEEKLPTLHSQNLIVKDDAQSIEKCRAQIYKNYPGPYLILCDKNVEKYFTNITYIKYDRKPITLMKINNLKDNETALLIPGLDSTGINLTNINTVIFIHPANHLAQTYLQALGRVTRVSSKNKDINLILIHKRRVDCLLCQTFKHENEIMDFCKAQKLMMIKSVRDKYYLTRVIESFVKKFGYDDVAALINPMLFTVLTRIAKKEFYKVSDLMSQTLHVKHYEVAELLGS